MVDLPTARSLLSTAPESCDDRVVLTYDDRLLRRKRLITETGGSFLVDLATVTNLDDHWGFRLDDGRAIEVVAAKETLVQITGAHLLRYAWHIGNRHTPCQIEPQRLLIRADPVLEHMLAGLGATLTPTSEPFTPEGGAYGHGRTMGHDHGGHDHGRHGHAAQDHVGTFGWHDHGDGHPHYHPPGDRAAFSLPFGHKHAK